MTVKTCNTIYDSLFCLSKLFKLNPLGSPFKAGEKRNFPLWDELSFSSRRYFLLKDTETEKVIFPLFLSKFRPKEFALALELEKENREVHEGCRVRELYKILYGGHIPTEPFFFFSFSFQEFFLGISAFKGLIK